jgi:hypothetical protein
MTSPVELKDVVKPPFANYDIVVYFGCGLFALPLIFHYFIEPAGFRFPRFAFEIGIPFADVAISTLSLLFAVYVLGHIIAYVGSVMIEKTIDSFFGKVSSAIWISTWLRGIGRGELVNAWVFGRVKRAISGGRGWHNLARVLFHLPVLPLYALVLATGGFDYYRSRVPRRVMERLQQKSREAGYGDVGLHEPWFKTIEHDVINNQPVATARMYNFLVISGTFRSLSLLFLVCIWCEIYFLVHFLVDGELLTRPLMHEGEGHLIRLIGIALLMVVYGFSVSSYMKFNRRYAEEAIFAYALERPR